MSAEALISMLGIMLTVVGGFAWFLTLAIRKERKKQE